MKTLIKKRIMMFLIRINVGDHMKVVNKIGEFIDKHIGLRVFKTAFAVCASLYVSMLLGSRSYFSGLAAVITMQSSISSSFEFGRNRIYATFMGICVALIFHMVGFLGMFAIFIGIMIVIRLCMVFHWKKSVSLACIVFILVMLFNPESSRFAHPYQYGLIRLVDTAVGVIISLLVNQYIFPPREDADHDS